jgi:hypothetical protein
MYLQYGSTKLPVGYHGDSKVCAWLETDVETPLPPSPDALLLPRTLSATFCHPSKYKLMLNTNTNVLP